MVEIADEQAEYCGLLLAGLGADVWKIEPPGGAATRAIGPFLDDEAGPERSLFFWQYNRNKRSIVLDPARLTDRITLDAALAGADVVLVSRSPGRADPWRAAVDAVAARFPRAVVATLTPFGESGPWAGYRGSDLVHLALGGVMMNCGYDPEPDGHYDLPPIAPQMWQAYQIAGQQLAMGIVAALVDRARSGEGQRVTIAVHEAVAKTTEIDLMSWVMRRAPVHRLTCRHASEVKDKVPTIGQTEDGRWLLPMIHRDEAKLDAFLERYGMPRMFTDEEAAAPRGRQIPGTGGTSPKTQLMYERSHQLIRSFTFERAPWIEAQGAGLMWVPLRRPHENATDEHWLKRGAFGEVAHPELGRSFTYATSMWRSSAAPWRSERRAPLLDEDRAAILGATAVPAPAAPAVPRTRRSGRAKALDGVRVFDFSWFLASSGGTRFLAAFGAEVLKVEWHAHPDTRMGAMAPVGGRTAREKATAPLASESDPAMGGQFNNKNAGKRGLSLNVRHPEGLAIAKRLVAVSDVVAEGFSPGVMERWGLGYDVLRSIKPDIIYAQQSGMGTYGTYGRMRTVGPVAAAFSGLAEMSGLPEPAMPAGWGYSYLDWMAAYSFALAIMSGIHHRDRTGEGQWIDASQVETGIFLAGTAVLDWSANARDWARTGNTSPYKPAAPHAVYRTRGDDRWLAIACFTDEQFRGLATVARHSEWLADARFATLAARIAHLPELDRAVGEWTLGRDGYELMAALQAAGVPAGVCQTAEDRCDVDPQLAELKWLTEVTGTRIGRWPVAEVPVKLSRTPPHIGGQIDRGAPMYGEDNEYVLGEILGLPSAEIARLAADGVI